MPRRRAPSSWVGGIVACLGLAICVLAADRLWPPNLTHLSEASTLVVDRDGLTLRAFTTPDAQWRLPVEPEAVSPGYLRLLFSVEDKRFGRHPGVDPVALVRAAWQLVIHGRVVSGGSTLAMQVARLLEPRPRTFRAKLTEVLRALQLDAHLGQAGVLRAYLRLAPMGGNLQGVRAGSLAWFGKEPATLSDAESALLVALPQAPRQLRPDTFPDKALRARNRVLALALRHGTLTEDAVASARATPLPVRRRSLPTLSPHLAERLRRAVGGWRDPDDPRRDGPGRRRGAARARAADIAAARQRGRRRGRLAVGRRAGSRGQR